MGQMWFPLLVILGAEEYTKKFDPAMIQKALNIVETTRVGPGSQGLIEGIQSDPVLVNMITELIDIAWPHCVDVEENEEYLSSSGYVDDCMLLSTLRDEINDK
jgi:hypothetical protein